MKILLVDDDDLVREFVENCLVDEHHVVRSVGTVDDALKSVDQGACPDLLVTDYNLKDEVNGMDLAERLRGLCDMRVLVITGRPDLVERHSPQQKSIGLLAKPFTTKALLAAVDAMAP